MARARVYVTLKKSVFDPQGRTIHEALHSLGYAGVADAEFFRAVLGAQPRGIREGRDMAEVVQIDLRFAGVGLKTRPGPHLPAKCLVAHARGLRRARFGIRRERIELQIRVGVRAVPTLALRAKRLPGRGLARELVAGAVITFAAADSANVGS